MLRVTLTAVLGLMAGCDAVDGPPGAGGQLAASLESPAASREAILRSIPTNSDKRCVGISVVAEALLDGARFGDTGCEEATELAERIFQNLTSGRQLKYHPFVTIDDTPVAVDSHAAIDRLGTLVADRYKQIYTRMVATEEGRRKLLAAERRFVATTKEVDQILDADPDQLDAFFGSGLRTFPDGRVEETYHVVLIGKGPGGDKFAYDSNDPGTPVACRLEDTDEGVTVEWTCRYKDTGQTTTQRYLVVHKDKFFGVMLDE